LFAKLLFAMGAAVMKIRVQLLSGRDHVFEVGNDVDI